ncbi:MAG: LPS export ABC transporter permease LptF [Gammaproteobacteria bacterium]
MTIIGRYIGREMLLSMVAVLTVLLLVGISNQFVIYLADAAAGEIAAGLVLKVVGMHMPSLIGVLLPLSFFLGVILSLSRMYADAEMPALFACGMRYRTLVQVVLYPALGLTAVALAVNLWIAPHYLYEVAQVLAKAQTDLVARAIQPGRFQVSDDGQYVLYINSVAPDGEEAYDVFIAEQAPQDARFHLGVIASSSGYHWVDPASQNEYIVLRDGHRYQGLPGQGNYQLMTFKEYGLRVLNRAPKLRIKERAMPSSQLAKSANRDEQAELQWRICLSLSTVVLALWAVVLSKVRPRQGKYAKAFPAILLAIFYINGLIFARSVYEDSTIPAWIGIYWVPVLGLLLVGLVFWWQSKWRTRAGGRGV